MTASRKRVSYVIPPSAAPVPRLRLPPLPLTRLGRSAPLLIPDDDDPGDPPHPEHDAPRHPRHRLPVASLALDTCTILEGRHAPEGILYSGGRDGLVMSWGLGLPMKKRALENGRSPFKRGTWEVMTGWADELEDEDADGSDRATSDGDVIGDVPLSAQLRRRHMLSELNIVPYERQWETDLPSFHPGTKSSFRQCAQVHEDWVNDLILCNYDQTVVSASSDGSVKAWNPHVLPSSEPNIIGLHGDYVRCIAYSREQRWIASGSFDHTIKIWDLNGSSKTDPLANLVLPDATTSKSSIYALATDQFGHTIASGSPERVIRLWDPRTGKRTGKLVGHTDNIRTILISDDARYLLTGSADASIKLWSLASQRCLHTFTHHTDSVWALHSTHPSLEIFYSGDKSGLVCKTDVEGCADVSEGECILLCNESGETASAGINKILSMDDNLLWTASGDSSINRWRVPQRRSARAAAVLNAHPHQQQYNNHQRHDDNLNSISKDANGDSLSPFFDHSLTSSPTRYSHVRNGSPEFPSSQPSTRPSTATAPAAGEPTPQPVYQSISFDMMDDHDHDQDTSTTQFGIPYDSLIRLTSPNDPFYHLGRGGGPVGRAEGTYPDADVATLYSAASFLSIPRALTNVRVANAPPTTRGMFQQHPQARSASPLPPLPHPHTLHPNHHPHSRYQSQSPPRSPRSIRHHLSTPSLTQSQPRSRTSSPSPYYLTQTQTHHPDSESHPHPHSHLHPHPHSISHSNTYPPAHHPPHSRSNSPFHNAHPNNPHTHSHSRSHSLTVPPSSHHPQPPQPQPQQPAPPPGQAHPHPPILSSQGAYELRELASQATPLSRSPDHVIQGDTGIVRALLLNDRIHVLTVDTAGEVAVWDIVRGVCLGRYREAEVAAAVCGGYSSPGAAGAGAGAGGVEGPGTGSGAGSMREEAGTTATGVGEAGAGTNGGGSVPSAMGTVGERSPREALEAVREKIEGQAVIPKWASVETKGGVLVVHLNERCFEVEVYADEVGYAHEKGFTEESKLNLGKWVLRNLFIGFIREQQRLRRETQSAQVSPSSPTESVGRAYDGVLHSRTNVNAPSSPTRGHHHRKSSSPEVLRHFPKPLSDNPTFSSSVVVCALDMMPALPPSIALPADTRPAPLSAPLIPIQSDEPRPTNGQHPPSHATQNRGVRTRAVSSGAGLRPTTAEQLTISPSDYFASLTQRPKTAKGGGGVGPAFGTGGGLHPPASHEASQVNHSHHHHHHHTHGHTPARPVTSSNTGLMGRLKSFGEKINKRPVSAAGSSTTNMIRVGGGRSGGAYVSSTATSSSTAAASTTTTSTTSESRKKGGDMGTPERVAIQQVLSGSLSPPPSSELPTVAFPPQTLVLISEEGHPNHLTVYRGTVGSTSFDLRSLEDSMPFWLVSYLLQNKTPTTPQVSKVSFVLLPWASKDPEVETLPELLNTAQSKLTASRYLRVRKLVVHVQEKIEKINASRTGSPPLPLANYDDNQDSANNKSHAEDLYEILCNDILLPLDMTIAAVRQYVWKSSAELKMHYRLKIGKRRLSS